VGATLPGQPDGHRPDRGHRAKLRKENRTKWHAPSKQYKTKITNNQKNNNNSKEKNKLDKYQNSGNSKLDRIKNSLENKKFINRNM